MISRAVTAEVLVFLGFLVLVKCTPEQLVYVEDSYSPRKNDTPLQCWVCNSRYDPRCADPFNPYTIGFINCSDRLPPETLVMGYQGLRLMPTVCRKTVQIVEGETRVIRDCGYISDERDNKECVRRTGTKNVKVTYCACNRTLCNTGHSEIRPTFLSAIFSLGIVFSCLLLFS